MSNPTPAEIREVSHMVAFFSDMLRSPTPPSQQKWRHTRELFPADKAFEVSNWLIKRAQNMEARENAA